MSRKDPKLISGKRDSVWVQRRWQKFWACFRFLQLLSDAIWIGSSLQSLCNSAQIPEGKTYLHIFIPLPFQRKIEPEIFENDNVKIRKNTFIQKWRQNKQSLAKVSGVRKRSEWGEVLGSVWQLSHPDAPHLSKHLFFYFAKTTYFLTGEICDKQKYSTTTSSNRERNIGTKQLACVSRIMCA